MAEPESTRARALPLPDARGDRLPWLDGLRGVAILAVLATHLTLATSGEAPSRFDRVVRSIAGPGWIGVDLFFVLSGFLITGILLDTKGGNGYFRQFYSRRALRIFPAYYAFLAAMLFLTPIMYPHAGAEYDMFRHSLGWFVTYQTNIWVMIRDGRGIELFGNVHLWSLAVEEQFYLVWPIVVLACNRRALVRVCVALIVVAAALRALLSAASVDPMVTYTLTPTRADTLALGALLAVGMRDPNMRELIPRIARQVLPVSLAAVVIIALVRHGLAGTDRGVQLFALTPLALSMAALVALGFGGSGAYRGALSAGWLRWMGRYSYGFYVVHWPIIYWLAHESGMPEMLARRGVPEVMADPLFWVVASAASFAATLVSWHLVEKHFLKLKRRVPYGAPDAIPSSHPNVVLDEPVPA